MIQNRIAAEQGVLTAQRSAPTRVFGLLQTVSRFGRQKPLGAVGGMIVLVLLHTTGAVPRSALAVPTKIAGGT